MRYKLAIIAAIIALTFGFMFYDRTSITTDPEPTITEHNQPAPDVTFTLLNGGTLPLRSLSGKTILLHFWASWCIPCRQEFSSLLTHMQKANDNTVLLAISADSKAEDATRFLAAYKRDFKSLFDSGKVILAHDPHHTLIEGVFQTFKYPETIVIAPDYTLRRKIIGPMQEGQY